MDELSFSVGPYYIKARVAEVRDTNLAGKFIRTFKKQLSGLKGNLQVYNLIVNGNGRFYYALGSGIVAMYVLNEFSLACDLVNYIPEIYNILIHS